MRHRHKRNLSFVWAFFLIAISLGVITYIFLTGNTSDETTESRDSDTNLEVAKNTADQSSNPLKGKRFYVEPGSNISSLVDQLHTEGRSEDAALAQKIAVHPTAIWLNGPTPGDPQATVDIIRVAETSADALKTRTVPLYQLYAIPSRDACASYSKGGHSSDADYLTWVERILNSLKTPSVFTVEADAIAQTIRTDCLNNSQTAERYALIAETVKRMKRSSMVLAVYVDAGHSEWFTDPKLLVEPLKKAGLDSADGIAANVSYFVDTEAITVWSKQLLANFSGNKGVVIDTSRNGKGVAPPTVIGEGRWCNPVGRGIGLRPTTDTADPVVHAYAWIKIPGESDGNCRGYPTAGTFVPSIALELARNSN